MLFQSLDLISKAVLWVTVPTQQCHVAGFFVLGVLVGEVFTTLTQRKEPQGQV